MNTVIYPARLCGQVSAPASKSEAHRRMLCAGLGAGETVLQGYMDSNDMTATRSCLEALGASFVQEGDTLTVRGCEKKVRGTPMMDCLESGSTLRFFVPIAMTRAQGGVFRMHGRLGQRPMDVYRDLFVPHGTKWETRVGIDGVAELYVSGKLKPGDYVLPGNVSSQFVSGLLFALPMLDGDSTLTVEPPVESAGYIRMTLKGLRESGIVIEDTGDYAWKIPGNQKYAPVSGHLSGDYTQAAVFLCAAALGEQVTVCGLNADTVQGDAAVLEMLEKLGAKVERNGDAVRVTGGELHGAELDLHDCPDIAPILALVCQLAEGESVLRDCGRLRLKECDRLEATAQMLNDLGGCAEIRGDDLIIRGVKQLHGGKADVRRDHRMVMLASIAALYCDGPVTIEDADAVAKSWPDYLKVYQQLGGHFE